MENRHQLGKEGEGLAKQLLIDKGYQILECNWRHKKAEIDIIAKINQILVFVEVKTRSTDFFGAPEEFLSTHQEKLLVDAAAIYMDLIGHQWEIRFDIISIVKNRVDGARLKHIEDAFFPGLQ